MKKIYTQILIIGLFVLMLSAPDITLSGAKDGLELWFHTVLPTLLPFMIFSNLMICTGSAFIISKILAYPFKKIFRISAYGSYAMLLGVLCGYPMGSKIIADLMRDRKITLSEGQSLLAFCNHPSPVFVVSYLMMGYFKNSRLIIPTLIFLYLIPIMMSFLYRSYVFYQIWSLICKKSEQRFHQKKNATVSLPIPAPHLTHTVQTESHCQSQYQNLDYCISNAVMNITKIGGYIILFSIFLNFATTLFPLNHWTGYLLLPSLELTDGIALLCKQASSLHIKYPLCLFHTAFGGWCAVVQTSGMITDTGLSLRLYITEKLITASVISFIAYTYISFLY